VKNHRNDIDGLRAVAVLSVIVYHCSHALLPGGFTGVDIFFVISGYLITRIIAAELLAGEFSLAEFYVRRAKRILPALFVVLAATLLAGFLLLTPSNLSKLGASTAATAAFVSNFVFWLDTGYFDAAAEQKPLLHTWSLGVEEQFYLLWPLMLMVLARPRWSPKAPVVIAIILSFALSCVVVTWHQPTAFFLLPTRAWELLMGAALALRIVPSLGTQRARDAAALMGLALIVAGLTLLDGTRHFPGWNALLPCVGAALLIHAGERGDNVVSRYLLSLRPMVFIGLISYSLYLWHWPLLSLARSTQDGPLTLAQAFSMAAVSVVLATLTWRFVETPMRARGRIPHRAPILARYAAASVVVLALGVYLQKSHGLLEYASPEIMRTELAREDDNPLSDTCLLRGHEEQLTSPTCIVGEERFGQSVVIWGDSHADSAMPGIVESAAKLGFATEQLTMAACPPLIAAEVEGPDFDGSECAAFNSRVMEYLRKATHVRAVVLSARWPVYTENSRFGTEDPGPITYLVDSTDAQWSRDSSRRVFSRSLETTVNALRNANKRVVLFGAIPAMGVNLPECIARRYLPFSEDRDCAVSAALVLPRMQFADSEINRVAAAAAPGVCSYLPKTVLCTAKSCTGEAGGEILYANDDHLSAKGARYMTRRMDLRACIVASRETRVNANLSQQSHKRSASQN
jgi:peptidoglycan/LPS O-acetylase OafA/YrhL